MPKQKNKYQDEFSFLYDLINDFTTSLDIDNKLFYFMVQREINSTTHLQGLTYHKKGLSKNKELFKIYKKQKNIHEVAPYLASFSRLLSTIYGRAVKVVGEEKAENALHACFNHLKKKYSVEPNLEGYVPRVAIGKAAAAAAAAAAAFDVSLMDNMLNYVLTDVIKKGITPAQKKMEAVNREGNHIPLTPEESKLTVRNIYLQALGPLGGKKYDQIQQTTDFPVILEQIVGFKERGIINEEKADLMTQNIQKILGVKTVRNPGKEIKRLYSQTFGAIGEDLFREIENNLNYAAVRKHLEKLTKEQVIKEEEKNKLLEKIRLGFGLS